MCERMRERRKDRAKREKETWRRRKRARKTCVRVESGFGRWLEINSELEWRFEFQTN